MFEKNWGNGGRMLHEETEPQRAHPPGCERCLKIRALLLNAALEAADSIVEWIEDHHLMEGRESIQSKLDAYSAARSRTKP